MNLVICKINELKILTARKANIVIPCVDARYTHVKSVLKKKCGDTVKIGVCNNPFVEKKLTDVDLEFFLHTQGEALITEFSNEKMTLEYGGGQRSAPPYSVNLLLGCPRPIQAARIFKDLTSLGVQSIAVCKFELTEQSYMESNFYQEQQYYASLLEGASQAANPCLPQVERFWSFKKYCESKSAQIIDEGIVKIVLHPKSNNHLRAVLHTKETYKHPKEIVIAIGSERGYTNAEIELFTQAGFTQAHLGGRILKTETASIVASTLAINLLSFTEK